MRVIPNVLIIDDDRFFLEFYRAELSQYNVKVDFASDGEEGLKKAIELKPDVILLDIILPKKDGFEVLEELKGIEETKDIPVIINSTLRAKSDVDKLLKLGAIKAFNKLHNLPSEIAEYLQSAFKKGGFEQVVKKQETSQTTQLSKEQADELFKDSLKALEESFTKLFSKKADTESFNITLIPLSKFKDHIDEMAKVFGTIFIYGEIQAEENGIAILSMKRNDTLSLIRLIGETATGKDMGFTMDDRVVEEFFNIAINAFLTKLSGSIKGPMILQSPKITNPKSIKKLFNATEISDKLDAPVVFLEEAYKIEELNLSFSLFVVFNSKLFKKD